MSGCLVLETGEIYRGICPENLMGRTVEDRAGEVVFNTSHSGYEEIATDPSYYSQIIVMTAPMQGNYGAHRKDWESDKIWIEGFVCLQIQNTKRDKKWIEQLSQYGVSILTEVDTRSLVLRLREKGTSWGALLKIMPGESEASLRERADSLISNKKKKEKDWVYLASRHQIEDRKGVHNKGPKIAVLDFGSKENILRELMELSSQIRIFPSRTHVDEIMSWKPDGLMLTNGPGDPVDVQISVQTVSQLIGKLPIFGICMGHQILALALGGQTYKLKFGHRGSNHPIKDLLIGKVYVTSQNHGYAVRAESLPSDVQVTHINLNDQTVAGIYSEKRKCLGIQYHPESHPGPHEARLLFRYFVEKMI